MKQSLIFSRCLTFLFVALLTLAVVSPVYGQADKVPLRSEIDDKYKWRVEDIYETLDDWNADFDAVMENLPRFEQYPGHLGDSPELLLECLKLSDSIGLVVDNLFVFAYLKLDEDNRAGQFQELAGRAQDIRSRRYQATAFVEPELLSLDRNLLLGWVDSNPGLKEYGHYLDAVTRLKDHVLSAEEEALLAQASPVLNSFRRTFDRLEATDLQFGSILDENGNEVDLSLGRISRFLESPDRRVRKDARLAQNMAYYNVRNTLSALFESSLRKDYFLATARGYNTCLEYSLDANNIPTSVFHNIVEATNQNLAPLHKWASIQKRILDVDTLYAWDLYVPLVRDFDKEYSYEEAQAMVLEAMKPLGEDYLEEFEKGLALGSGWIDVYETQGKGGGAYSWGTYSSHPYILLNHTGTLDNVFAIAHEMGHAMHTYLTIHTQPYIYEDCSLFLAEVASGCHEALMMKYMLDRTTDKKEKMYLLNYYIQQIIGVFFTQLSFSEFELAVHERIESGQAVSADYFRETYREIFEKYRGPDLVVDSLNDLGGIRIPHFYRQYYVYQYAVGYAAGQMLSQQILDGEPGAVERFMTFMKDGGSNYPIETLKKAGVDATRPEAVERTLKLFGELVDEMERLLDEG
ncbi:MAG: oligoendopeptidase F [Candidatus Zixiibacteriota bacterium]|nr:MAG: oligoendopeptidase F [candidate division Zixibacteria bacterium]